MTGDLIDGADQHGAARHGHSHRAVEQSTPAEFWEDFYQRHDPWSGKPNAVLVDELGRRPAHVGAALDLGCGTGADAIWLAQQGWQVTGVDLSQAALDQAASAAQAAGVSDRAHWLRQDLEADFPDGTWDLVTAAYLHSPVALQREHILRRAAAAVAPGGTLLVIGHQAPPSWAAAPPDLEYPSPDDLLAMLDLDDWAVERAEIHTVVVRASDTTPGHHSDNVVRLGRAHRPGA